MDEEEILTLELFFTRDDVRPLVVTLKGTREPTLQEINDYLEVHGASMDTEHRAIWQGARERLRRP